MTTTTTMTTLTAVGDVAELETLPRQQEQTISKVLEEPEPDQALDKATIAKLISAGLSFYVAGINDGSLGALMPYLLRYYDISTAMISVIYGTTFCGWLVAALSNTHLSQHLDLGAMLAVGAALQLAAHALRVWLPPFPLFASTFFLVSLGQAFQDTHANTFVSSVSKTAHRWLGFIHAMYMAGCLTGPLVSTAVASGTAGARWKLFYLLPTGLGVANLALVCLSFRDNLRLLPKRVGPDDEAVTGSLAESPSRSQSAMMQMKQTLSIPGVWLLSLFYFFYLGAAITAGGWVVEYLVAVRKGDIHAMGYVSAGFSGGALVGRLFLAEPTHRFGERRMLLIYSALCVAFQLVFWLVPNIVAASVAISLFGLFSGPFFAAGISVGSRIFPPEVVPSALAFVFVFGQLGGSLFPVVTGVVAARYGVGVLQPMLVGLLVATAISWLLVPSRKAAGVHTE